MASLSREIELYLKELLAQEAGRLEINRSALSNVFSCVPSQINYVLSTRFTLDKGYLVESRRGGGGYVRITAIPLEETNNLDSLRSNLKEELSEQELEGILAYLYEEGVIGKDFMSLFASLFSDSVLNESLNFDKSQSLRAHFLKNLLARISLINRH